MNDPTSTILTVSGILFGFLVSGFWWILNREVKFEPEGRHFKLGTGLLFVSMVLLGAFGIAAPLKDMAEKNPTAVVLLSYRGVLLALVGIYGYMLTELGHYRVYQLPKYTTKIEWILFSLTLLVLLALVVKWWVI
jgi:hypothetical protein